MKSRYFLFVITLCFQLLTGQTQYLSNEAKISVLTVGPGTSLNDAFGHSGFRVKDSTGLDVVFNYGVYDFNAPNFYLKFAQGKLNYLIGANYFRDFYNNYVEENRSIGEQVLNLTQKEKQALYNYLLNNYKPENRRYLYDFFYDNCATRIKDVVLLNVSQPVTFNLPNAYHPATFRELIHQNVAWNSWGRVGIDIALGAIIDKQTTPEEQMFLPENIARFFEAATLGDSRSLVASDKMLFEKDESVANPAIIFNPLLVFSLFAIMILFTTCRDIKKKQRSKWLDTILFGFTGLIGIGLLFLWFATNHTATAFNYNLLWAFPLNLLAVFQVLKESPKPWMKKYLKLLIVLLALMVFHWISGVQVFAWAIIPLLVALAVRYVFLVKHLAAER